MGLLNDIFWENNPHVHSWKVTGAVLVPGMHGTVENCTPQEAEYFMKSSTTVGLMCSTCGDVKQQRFLGDVRGLYK